MFSGTIPAPVAKAERGKKKKKPRTIDTVFVPSKPARYRHKYVKCCVDEYFEHYTFGTASNSKYIQKDEKKKKKRSDPALMHLDGLDPADV